jgi:hypothetical protein
MERMIVDKIRSHLWRSEANASNIIGAPERTAHLIKVLTGGSGSSVLKVIDRQSRKENIIIKGSALMHNVENLVTISVSIFSVLRWLLFMIAKLIKIVVTETGIFNNFVK